MRECIVLVIDEEFVFQSLKHMLESSFFCKKMPVPVRFTVNWAPTVELAQQALASTPTHILFCKLGVPDSGQSIAAIGQLQATVTGTHAICMSPGFRPDEVTALEQLRIPVIEKPWSADELAQTVRASCSHT